MQIIFLKDVKKQGKKGEIKEVKDGYANFLINNKLATKLNNNSLRELERENKKDKEKKEQEREEANKLKKQLEGKIIEFKVKVGVGDKVFGSITTKQIKDKLQEENIKIDKNQIEATTSLASLGFHEVIINLYKDINAKIKIHIIK